jgi:hypothetical protein
VSGRLAIATVVAKNYLPFARAWTDSIRRQHPDLPLYVLLADEPEGYFTPDRESFHVLRLADVRLPPDRHFFFRNNRQEVVIASKPYVLSHLLEIGFQSAIFLDTDILVLSALDELFTQVSRHALTLTPHILDPLLGNDRIERELNILQAGVFNGGFIGVSNTPATHRFLAWWQERHVNHCRHDVPRGMHYDQRWLDFAPSFVEDLRILRDPVYNVAYWNLPERDPRMNGDQVLIGGRPCAFFHFSGFDPSQPLVVTKYRPNLELDSIGPVAKLFKIYTTLLEQSGYRTTAHWPYVHGCFDNRIPIPDLARLMYRDLGDEADRFGDPFSTRGPASYLDWLNEPIDDEVRPISRLWKAAYDRRPDVQRTFPDWMGAHREAFLQWTMQYGAREHDIAEYFLGTVADRPVTPYHGRRRSTSHGA